MQLYAITDRRQLPGSDSGRFAALLELARNWANHGVHYIQIREKDLAPPELRALAEQIVTAARSENRGTRVLLNGPAEIALETGADGIHLPANAPAQSAAEARNLFARAKREAIISYSCHNREEVLKAKEASQQHPNGTTANTLILYAPVFEKMIPDVSGLATDKSSSMRSLPGAGLECLQHAVEAAKPIPVFALGGITLQNAQSCIAAGAIGIAGIRLFLHHPALPL